MNFKKLRIIVYKTIIFLITNNKYKKLILSTLSNWLKFYKGSNFLFTLFINKNQSNLPFFSGGLEWNRLWCHSLVERSCLRTAAADNRSRASFPAGASHENLLPCFLHLEHWMALFQFKNHQIVIVIFLLNTPTKQDGIFFLQFLFRCKENFYWIYNFALRF